MCGMATVRPAAVAGTFYPADPNDLRASIESLLEEDHALEVDIDLKILVVPHAGYVYSGSIAAKAFRLLEG